MTNDYPEIVAGLNALQNEINRLAKHAERGQSTVGTLVYAALALPAEAGEVADEVKKQLRSLKSLLDADFRTRLFYEAGDVMFYLSFLADALGMSLGQLIVTGCLNKLKG